MLERAEVVFSLFFQKKELPPVGNNSFILVCGNILFSVFVDGHTRIGIPDVYSDS